MIKSIQIKNFKSIVDLKMDLGSFNVLIGENGAGKSNIIEGIALGAAANANKLDFEFLGSRGVRLSNPESMFAAFKGLPKNNEIIIEFAQDAKEKILKYSLTYTNDNKWESQLIAERGEKIRELFEELIFNNPQKRQGELDKIEDNSNTDLLKQLNSLAIQIEQLLNDKSENEEEKKKFYKTIFSKVIEDRNSSEEISNFIVFSPEQTSLRKFEDTTQIYPLGIKGEGIFQYLKKLNPKKAKDKKLINEIKENMTLLDWYEDFNFPTELLKNELSLSIKDRFLREDLNSFDQRNTNEGFLFLLFYSVLFCSGDTPKFFAIDNIDAGLNPKLTMKLVQNLAELAKKHKKQVILTTHSPAVLDALNLKDNSQRLFVIKRNDDGFTTTKKIDFNSKRRMKLSEIWTDGFIGGLPENF